MQKRGVSEVIGVVVIIFLTIVIVAVIWTIILPKINKDISFNKGLAEVTIETSGGYTVYDSKTGIASVQVKRGPDQLDISGIDFIFSFEGNSQTFASDDPPGPNEKKTYYFNLSKYELGKPDYVRIALRSLTGNLEKVGDATLKTDLVPGSASGEEGDVYCTDCPVSKCLLESREECSQYEALKSSGAQTTCSNAGCTTWEKWCNGADINKDRVVNETDENIMMKYTSYFICDEFNFWCEGADINRNGFSDGVDINLLVTNFNKTNCDNSTNLYIGCYAPCSLEYSENPCSQLPGCYWDKFYCNQDSDCLDEEECYDIICNDNRKCEYIFNNESECVDCGKIISKPNTYLSLTNDLVNCKNFGIMINAKNVTIDCQGHEITGSDNPKYYNDSKSCSGFLDKLNPSGIFICKGKGYNYTIKNCIIHNFLPETWLYGGAIADYVDHDSSYSSTIKNNQIYDSMTGVFKFGGFDIIKNNTFENCYYGLYLDEGCGDLVEENTFENCHQALRHYCNGGCSYKWTPTNITKNTFINNPTALYFTTQKGWWGVSGALRDNAIQNTFVGISNDIHILTQNESNLEQDDIKLYFNANTFNGEPLDPYDFLDPAYISDVPF